ncbi:hypothetical protein GINT2_001121 [Glugoides intestinalis]
MGDKIDRTTELVKELKDLLKVNTALNRYINAIDVKLYDKDSEIKALASQISTLQSKVNFLEEEKVAIQKRASKNVKNLELELRKSSIFNKKVMATSKTKKEHLMIQEMDSLRKVNKTLLGFVEALSKRFSFDDELLKALAYIADGVDDRILQLFLDTFSKKNKKSIVNKELAHVP